MQDVTLNSLAFYKYAAIQSAYRIALEKADSITESMRKVYEKQQSGLNASLPEEMHLTKEEIKDMAERWVPTAFPTLIDILQAFRKQMDQDYALHVLEHDKLDMLGLSSQEELIEYIREGKHDYEIPSPTEVTAILCSESLVFVDDVTSDVIYYCSPLQDVW